MHLAALITGLVIFYLSRSLLHVRQDLAEALPSPTAREVGREWVNRLLRRDPDPDPDPASPPSGEGSGDDEPDEEDDEPEWVEWDEPCSCPPARQTARCRQGRHIVTRRATQLPGVAPRPEPGLSALDVWVEEQLAHGARPADIRTEGARLHRVSSSTIKRAISRARARMRGAGS